METDPYQPPTSDPVLPETEKEGDGAPCPQCGKPMQTGYLLSSTSLNWVANNDSFVRKNLLGGTRLPTPKNRFGGRHHGSCCPDCQLYLLEQAKH